MYEYISICVNIPMGISQEIGAHVSVLSVAVTLGSETLDPETESVHPKPYTLKAKDLDAEPFQREPRPNPKP